MATYYVSPTGSAAWASATNIATPCSLATANTNAAAGDIVYLRNGTYTIGASGVAVAFEPDNSGTAGNLITFSAYTGETPTLTQAGLTYKCYGALLNGNSYIKITGITFHNFQQYGCWIYGGGSYNEISYCKFTRDDAYDAGDRVILIGQTASPWSTHNWIHHNYIQGHHNTDPCSEAIDIIKVGGAQSSPAYSADNYNTIEYNYLEYSGHANIVTYSKYNVIRNNTSHNEPWLTGCTAYQYGTSTTSLAIGTGAKSITTQAGLSFTAGYPVSVISTADSDNVMWGTVTSYNSTTGALVISVTDTGGSGTYASWYLGKNNAPFYDDATYDGKYGHRVSCFGDSDIANDNWNLIEGNRFGFGGVNPNNGGPSCLDIESPRNIVRFNYVYGGMASGMYFKSATGEPTLTGGVNNRVYNNTVYHNGYGWDQTLYGALNVTYNGNGIAQHSNSGDTNNVIKNNIVYDNKYGDICWLGTETPPQTPWTGDTVENNLTGTDPQFVDPDLTDTTSQSLFSDVHGYAATPIPDLRLKTGSPALNAGTYLTQANGSGTASTTLIVDDADYFQDGTRGSSLSDIQADTIAVGTVENTAQISSIDYATNTITLATPLTWADNASVWLYEDSKGERVLFGAAPNIGAHQTYTIPASRSYDWASYCGVPGGIPTRNTIYQTMTTANTVSQINAAIAACPVGQVVYLAAGTYSISGIGRKSGVTVRGAGPGKTIINSGASVAFNYTGSAFNYDSGHQAIADGAWLAKGSLSVTLATTPGAQFVVGRLIMINQDDDHTLVFPRTGNWAGTRNLRHVSRITDITGNTITFSTPLPYTFVAAQNPGAQAIPCSDSLFGVEDMTIDALSCVRFLGSDRCWVYRCEIRGFDNEGIFLRDSHQCEIRRCYIHDCDGFPSQADGYGVYSQYAVSCLRQEDNIGYHIGYMNVMNGNDSSAYLYNYAIHMGRDAATRFWEQPAYNCNHGPHSIMNLWEGNFGERWQNDAYHGSASHQTLFRNNIHGVNPAYTLDRRIMDFGRTSYYFNAVGNIIGSATWNPAYYEASKTTGAGYWNSTLDRSSSYIWVLGYPNMGSGSLTEETALSGYTPPGGTYPDSNVAATLLRHANYDYYSDAVVYTDTDHDIPDSLFYDSKPSYFCDLTWPPIDPFTPTANSNPAKYRWDTYVGSSDLDDIFYAEYDSGENIVLASGSITTQSSATAVAYTTPPPAPDGIILGIQPLTQQVRKPTEAAYFVTCAATGTFSGNVTLSVVGAPAGAVVTFDDNPIAGDGGTTTLRIDTSGIAATDPTDGTDYNMTLKGIETA